MSQTNWWEVTAAAQLGFLVRDGDGSRLHGQDDGVAVGCVELDRDQCAHVRQGILAAPSKWGRRENVRDPEGLKPGRTAAGVNSRCSFARSGQLTKIGDPAIRRGGLTPRGCHEAMRGREPVQASHACTGLPQWHVV